MGSGPGQNLPNQPIKNVPDACECDQKCSHENSCEYWVYVEDSDDCWLKRSPVLLAVQEKASVAADFH